MAAAPAPSSTANRPASFILPQPSVAVRPASLIVVWRLTESCNLDCAFCEFRRSLRRPRRAARAEDVLAFGRVLGAYARDTGRRVLISWLGGEPLLWPPLWDVSRELRRAHSLDLSLTTNATRLDPGACRRLVADYAEVTLSVDGDHAFHERVRSAPGLYPRLRHAAETLAELKSARGAGPLIRANTVLMRSNLHALEPLASTLAGWGIEELTFNLLGGAPGDPFYDRERLRPADVDWLAATLPGLRARLAARGLRLAGGEAYLQRFAHTARGLPLPIHDCAPGQRFLFIDEAGRAAPCSFTSAEYGVPIAALRTLADLRALPALFAQRRLQHPARPCADCHSTQVHGKFVGGISTLPTGSLPRPLPCEGRGSGG
jgi:MoaA/NifB/PqqE/SkfB family radical SAM enzyme